MDDTPTCIPAILPAIMSDSAAMGFAMSCEPRTGALLAALTASKPGGRILELGTGAGAAWLLDGMDTDARLISVEIDRPVQAVARMHLGGDQRVTFETADAYTWLCNYQDEPFDLAVIYARLNTVLISWRRDQRALARLLHPARSA